MTTPAPHRLLAIIGGSGIYQMEGLTNPEWRRVSTPFGEPSDALLFGKLGDRPVVFLPRHGRGHRISPTEINFRANIAALKSVGVTDVLSLSAVGSLREDLPPGSFLIPDQFIDRTFAREKTFFGDGVVAHVSMARPVCGRLGGEIEAAGRKAGLRIARRGTYMVMEGPQFSTLAESRLYRSWGCDVIGMTNMPEAKLAREAELCYATVAMVTDFDCWHPEHAHVSAADVLATLQVNAKHAQQLVREVVERLSPAFEACSSGCTHALDTAVLTPPESRPKEAIDRLGPIASRILGPVSGAKPHDEAAALRALIRGIPDFPKKGILFRDITTLLKDREGFRTTVRLLAKRYRGRAIDKIAGIEARGLILGAALAYELGAGFVPLRKKGKLPGETVGQSYALEYGTDQMELHVDAIAPGDRVVLVDDLLATGGTAEAGMRLVQRVGGHVEESCFVIELTDLGGRKRLEGQGHGVFSLVGFEGE